MGARGGGEEENEEEERGEWQASALGRVRRKAPAKMEGERRVRSGGCCAMSRSSQ
jgi:hypothetical protein